MGILLSLKYGEIVKMKAKLPCDVSYFSSWYVLMKKVFVIQSWPTTATLAPGASVWGE